MRGSWRPNITIYFDPHSYGHQRCVFLVLQMLNRRPRGPLCWLMAFFTASYQQLPWTPTHQSPQGPFGLMWLSLPHLVYNSVRSLTVTATVWLLSWLSYIIVQRPLSRLLDLWNRMFDRHQTEITVMQFTGHSLPVHQSMFFTSSHFVSQFPPTRFLLITAIRMCHFLPLHHLGMAFLAGSKAKIQHYHNTTNHRKYLPQLELLWPRDIHSSNKHVLPKYSKTFDSICVPTVWKRVGYAMGCLLRLVVVVFLDTQSFRFLQKSESLAAVWNCLKSSSDHGAICIKLDLFENKKFSTWMKCTRNHHSHVIT